MRERVLALVSVVCACGPTAGEADSEIRADFATLAGGVVFATSRIPGSTGYDLYWAPVPLAGTADAQPTIRLTEAKGNEWQPSASVGGRAIAFARQDEGIFLITESGRIRQVSDTRKTSFKDSLPAVSRDGVKVAWVREDTSKPIGETVFFETVIMMANFDGTDERAVNPRPGAVQDAPAFDPVIRSTRLAWSEFSVDTLNPQAGPQNFGLWVHDYATNTGNFACKDPATVIGARSYRCFGQHLVWPVPDVLITPQNFLEVSTIGQTPTTILPAVIDSISSQQAGVAETNDVPGFPGFHQQFPLSASYDGVNRLVFDGLVSSIEGDFPSLGFFVAQVDGGGLWRLRIQNLAADADGPNTANFLFSVATPQLIPVPK